jgi:cation transport regulator
MPYNSNNDLPASIRDHLPEHAQTMFREAFNNAHKQYGTEEQAFKVAWSAVKQKYEKNSEGKWVEKK